MDVFRTTRSAAVATAVTLAAAACWAQEEEAYTRSVDDQALRWVSCPEFMPQGCEIAVLHGDPSEPNADIFYRVPGGAEISRHWHNSPERMVLVTGDLEVTYDGQEPAVMTPGAYAYGPARKPHSATCQSADPCTLFIGLVEPLDAMEGGPE